MFRYINCFFHVNFFVEITKTKGLYSFDKMENDITKQHDVDKL